MYSLTYAYQIGNHVLKMTSDWCEIDEAILYYERLMSHKDYQNLQAIDESNRVYTLKELKKEQHSERQSVHHLTLYFDASFNQQSKLSGLGVVLTYIEGDQQISQRKNLDTAMPKTVNEAEYYSLFHGLEQLKQIDFPPQKIDIYGDSLVVINQLKGEWPVLNETLAKWADEVEDLLTSLRLTPLYHHIDRKDNKQADRLASQAQRGTLVDATRDIQGDE
ncbi:ribonuclease HI [Halolactibacillus halophilus]|uniref:Ribonuclease HI n=1 Tax=Halolactibacillus halophilus TaxID=306540 RepID=A0A1I5MER8_9BACI|nr:reverse transcriptase-like protein [Halolactibacillus halophilus]GEM02216.1 hypothetical protein HHA03_17480 [Halolactibacillus halophilus]SFP08030.1 ribonuclease HI [Halolactibacillus halophilus]